MPEKIKSVVAKVSTRSLEVGMMSPYPQVDKVVVTKYKLVKY